MDEPMSDDSPSDGLQCLSSTSSKQGLRTSALNFQTMTVEEYEHKCWPILEGAILKLLTEKFGKLIPLSYEEMYSCVYRCVCRGQPDRLYKDTFSLISAHLDELGAALHKLENPIECIQFLQQHLQQYDQAMSGIVPIFNYMNRFYVETRLKASLEDQLKALFCEKLIDPRLDSILAFLCRLDSEPFSVPPNTVSIVVKLLYQLRPEYSKQARDLFSSYIPELVNRTSADQLIRYQEETRYMQQQLVADGFARGDQSRKRAGEEDEFDISDNQPSFKR